MVTEIGNAIGKPVRYALRHGRGGKTLALAQQWAERPCAEALVDIWRAVRRAAKTVSHGVVQVLGAHRAALRNGWRRISAVLAGRSKRA